MQHKEVTIVYLKVLLIFLNSAKESTKLPYAYKVTSKNVLFCNQTIWQWI